MVVAMHLLSRTAAALVAVIFAASLMVGAALAAASDFEGTWKTQDFEGTSLRHHPVSRWKSQGQSDR